MRNFNFLFGLFWVLFAAGCMVAPSKEIVDKAGDHFKEVVKTKEHDFASRDVVTDESGVYVHANVIRAHPKDGLPKIFDTEIVIVERPLSLSEAADRIGTFLGGPVRITVSTQSGKADMLATEAKELMTKMPMNFSGTLRGFIDSVTTYFGLSWRYDEGEIQIYKYETKTYSLAAALGALESLSTISNKADTNKGDSGSSSSVRSSQAVESVQSEQVTKTSANLDVWTDLVKNIQSMLSTGGSVVFSMSTGTITVTDTPFILEKVTAYVDDINKRLSRQVSINVKVYNFFVDDAKSLGFEIDVADNFLGLMIDGAKVATGIEGLSPMTAAIVESSTGWDRYAGSNLVLDALNQFGKVSLVTSGSGICLNNQPMPIQNIQRVSYLAEVTSTVSTNNPIETSLIPGQVSTGFSMTITPNILDNSKVILQYNISLSSLDSISEVASGDQVIQTPEVSTRSFMQRVAMGINSTLVLAGFKDIRNSYGNNKGFLGVGANSKDETSMIIVAIEVNEVDGAL